MREAHAHRRNSPRIPGENGRGTIFANQFPSDLRFDVLRNAQGVRLKAQFSCRERFDWFETSTPSTENDEEQDRKSTRLNSSHLVISYAVFCLKKNKRT